MSKFVRDEKVEREPSETGIFWKSIALPNKKSNLKNQLLISIIKIVHDKSNSVRVALSARECTTISNPSLPIALSIQMC